MPRKQIWSGVALVAAAAASLTGCSLKASDGTPQSFAQLSALSAQDAVKAAGRAVDAHPSAKVHTVLTSPDASEVSDVTATFDEHPVLQGTLTMGPADPSAPSAGGARPIPIRYADQIMFMNVASDPTMTERMAGKQWLRMDLVAMAADPRTRAVGSDVLENTSPRKGLTLLTAAKDLHKVGEEQHGGVPTVHYAGTLSGGDAMDPNLVGRGLTQEAADGVSGALAHGAVTELGYDLWLRADGLPVAQTFTEATPVGALKGEIDYSDWGTDVSVEAVPDTQSVDFLALVKQASGGSGSGGGQDASGAPSSPSTPSTPSSPSSTSTPSSTSSSSAPSVPVTPATPATPASPSTPKPTGSPATPATPTSSS